MYQVGDIILVSFPYSNFKKLKIRPALVLSDQLIQKFNDVIVLGITSKVLGIEELEVTLENGDLKAGILPKTSYVRIPKIVTLEKSLILKKVASLSETKIQEVQSKVEKVVLTRKQPKTPPTQNHPPL